MTDPDLTAPDAEPSLGELALEDRAALRRVAGLSTELADVSEVEYRQLRLERVVLVGVWTEGTAADADASLAELLIWHFKREDFDALRELVQVQSEEIAALRKELSDLKPAPRGKKAE